MAGAKIDGKILGEVSANQLFITVEQDFWGGVGHFLPQPVVIDIFFLQIQTKWAAKAAPGSPYLLFSAMQRGGNVNTFQKYTTAERTLQ